MSGPENAANAATPAPVQISCGGCMAFSPNAKTEGKGGECHLHPPSVVVINRPGKPDILQGGKPTMEQSINTVFPPVPIESWCLHFMPRPQVAVQESVSLPEGNT